MFKSLTTIAVFIPFCLGTVACANIETGEYENVASSESALAAEQNFWSGFSYRFGESPTTGSAQTVLRVTAGGEAYAMEVNLFNEMGDTLALPMGTIINVDPSAAAFEVRLPSLVTEDNPDGRKMLTPTEAEGRLNSIGSSKSMATLCGARVMVGHGTAVAADREYQISLAISPSSALQEGNEVNDGCGVASSPFFGPANDEHCPDRACTFKSTNILGTREYIVSGRCRYSASFVSLVSHCGCYGSRWSEIF